MRRRRSTPAPALLYAPGSSWLHRAPAGVKLVALVGISAAVVAIDHPAVSGGVLAAGIALILAAGVPPRTLARAVRPFVLIVVVLILVQLALGRFEQGVAAAARILAVATLALAVTLTTRPSALVEWLERMLTRLGVGPVRVFRIGLAVGIALRSLEHLGVVAQRVLDARRARGLQRSLRAFAVPTVVAAARFAHGVGEALEARGIADPDLARRRDPGG